MVPNRHFDLTGSIFRQVCSRSPSYLWLPRRTTTTDSPSVSGRNERELLTRRPSHSQKQTHLGSDCPLPTGPLDGLGLTGRETLDSARYTTAAVRLAWTSEILCTSLLYVASCVTLRLSSISNASSPLSYRPFFRSFNTIMQDRWPSCVIQLLGK